MILLKRHIRDRIINGSGIGMDDISSKLFQLGHENKLNSDYIDLDITPNRGDCLSLQGIIRDLGNIYDVDKYFDLYDKEIDSFNLPFINKSYDACPKIAFLEIEIEEPKQDYEDYLNEYFTKLGNKKNNLFTDISNYLCYELGQPSHCYDANKINSEIILGLSTKELPFTTLTGKKVLIEKGELLFFQDGKPMNLAGVMGGLDTSCNKETRKVLVEFAFFKQEFILGKSLKYDLKSEAAYRFERGTDILGHDQAIRRYIRVLEDHAKISSMRLFEDNSIKFQPRKIEKDKEVIEKILGINLEDEEFDALLNSNGLEFDTKIMIPSYRNDISSQNDIAEEIARVVGYDNIPMKFKKITKKDAHFKNKENTLRASLISLGFNEVINFPFTKDSSKKSIKVVNPLDSGKAFLRTDLKNSLISNLSYNERRQKDSIKLFEISEVYSKSSSVNKKKIIGMILSGRQENSFRGFTKKIDKNFILNELSKILAEFDHSCMEEISRDNVSSKLKNKIFYIEMDLDELALKDGLDRLNIHNQKDLKYKKISEQPSIIRDLSFSSKSIPSLELLNKKIHNLKYNLLRSFFVFDFFENPKTMEIKIGYRFIFSSVNETLKDAEIDNIIDEVVSISSEIDGIRVPGYEESR